MAQPKCGTTTLQTNAERQWEMENGKRIEFMILIYTQNYILFNDNATITARGKRTKKYSHIVFLFNLMLVFVVVIVIAFDLRI